MFWISYLRLPIGRCLQLGDGFWFFAADGPEYRRLASAAAEDPAYLLSGKLPSSLFARFLAILVAAFANVASLAILINCAAYDLMCVVLARMGKNDVLLTAITFSPAAMLFSFQLLKDTVFFLLIVLMVAVFRRWQESCRRDPAAGQLLACAAVLLGVVYALAGIRWYFASMVRGASAVFFVS